MQKLFFVSRALSILILTASLVLLIPASYYWLRNYYEVASLSSKTVKIVELKPANLVTGQPVRITIPNLKMNLPVVPGTYDALTGQWTSTLTAAVFAEPTATPNNITGDSFIYGHDQPAVFLSLHNIKVGDQATITTSNGYSFTYTYKDSQAFTPTNTSVFSYKGRPRLTLQTCSGTFNQNRQMYYFTYDGYSKVTS